MPRWKTALALLLLLVVTVTAARAQTGAGSQTTTEQRLRELRDQIRRDEDRLSQTALAEQASLETLNNLDREIALRRELTSGYQERLLELSRESDSLNASTGELQESVDQLKGQYRIHAVHAYKYGRLHDLALILAAKSINQMLIRVRYLTRFADERRERYDEIKETVDALEMRRALLDSARVETENLLAQAEVEQRELARLQQSRQQVVQQLRTQRSSLQQELTQKRQAATAFETRLRELITTETNRRRSGETSASDYAEFRTLTGSFRSNQGRLPWPTNGFIVEPFGEVINPVHGTSTPNPGVLIASSPQVEVRAVFEGTVLSVSVIPEFGRYVLIEHGEYQTAYSNFSLIYLAEGDRVQAGQVIGRAGTDDEPKGAGIFFAVFENGQAVDPATWLGPR